MTVLHRHLTFFCVLREFAICETGGGIAAKAETNAAHTLGEDTRTDHRGTPYDFPTPTSTAGAKLEQSHPETVLQCIALAGQSDLRQARLSFRRFFDNERIDHYLFAD